MNFNETTCRGIYEKIATKTFDSELEATEFYRRKVIQAQSKFKISLYGEESGFKKRNGIDFYLPKDAKIKRDGTPFNVLLGLPIPGFAQTYIGTLNSRLTPILLLSDIWIHSIPENYVDAYVTFNPEKASYVLIMEQIAYNGKGCHIPWKVKKKDNIVFTATQQVENGKSIRYFVFKYAFPCPYKNTGWGPVLTSYRNQLFEDYLEQNFLLNDSVATTEAKQPSENEENCSIYHSYHFEDNMSREQAFAIGPNGRIIAPTKVKVEAEKYVSADVAQMETWEDLPENSWIVKYQFTSSGEIAYSFIKRGYELTPDLEARLWFLESELEEWKKKHIEEIRQLLSAYLPGGTVRETWSHQLEDEAKAAPEETSKTADEE